MFNYKFSLIVSALLFAFGFACLTQAQVPMTGGGLGTPVVVAYSGPGDVVSGAKWWVGLRAYNSAKRGNPAINVCNVADVACADMSTDASTGALVIGTIGGSSCSIVTCTIKTFYDQTQGTECSGAACDFTQATIAARPTLTVSCITGLPCAACTIGASTIMATPTVTSYAQPYTVSSASVRTGGFTTLQSITGNGTFAVGYAASTNTVFNFAGFLPTATAADSTFHAFQFVSNGASGDININGSVNTINAGPAASGAGTIKFCNGATQPVTGNVSEVGFWAAAFSGANSTAMSANQRGYWGF